MTSEIKSVCVYCASSTAVDEKYFKATRELGEILAKNKTLVVYGGGAKGLMGCLADETLKHGGKVKGVLPGFMRDVEWQHNALTELVVVETMHDRKALLIRDVDAVIALPGGCGTLEELFEAITAKRLGLFLKPIIIVNVDGYYDHLLKFLENSIEEKFMRESHRDCWIELKDVSQILTTIQNAPTWSEDAIKTATL